MSLVQREKACVVWYMAHGKFQSCGLLWQVHDCLFLAIDFVPRSAQLCMQIIRTLAASFSRIPGSIVSTQSLSSILHNFVFCGKALHLELQLHRPVAVAMPIKCSQFSMSNCGVSVKSNEYFCLDNR